MDKLLVEGGRPLKGNIKISGAKNACLPLLAAMILTEGQCTLRSVPDLKDVNTMINILASMGKTFEKEGDVLKVLGGRLKSVTAAYEMVSTMRASIAVLGPLLAKYGEARVSFPGGCVIGPRPIDLHLKGLKALGAQIRIEEGYIIASAKKLKGARIYLGGHFGSSVLATANIMMAATLADGETIIEDAAGEPEVADLANFLVSMGADIKGIGTSTVKVRGVKELKGADHTIITDRIEAGTFMIAAVMTDGRLFLENARPDHNLALIDKLTECGGVVEEKQGGIEVYRAARTVHATHITTLSYPGFPTDLQAQMMALTTLSDGISVITEKIYPERFIHISELNRMGAEIMLEGSSAIIKGVKRLSGAPVMASDLRASAALVLAGLVAEGKTEIARIYHLDRGYEHIEQKISSVGGKVKRIKEDKRRALKTAAEEA